MGVTETLIFYLAIGCGVGIAVFADEQGAIAKRIFQGVLGVVFWPLHLPILLSASSSPRWSAGKTALANSDPLVEMIEQAEVELEDAWASLAPWATEMLADQRSRIVELRSRWRAQAVRIRELDALLQKAGGADEAALEAEPNQRIRHSEEVRLRNIQRLQEVRRQTYEDFTAALASVRELASSIHVAKFTGESDNREKFVVQIASAIDAAAQGK